MEHRVYAAAPAGAEEGTDCHVHRDRWTSVSQSDSQWTLMEDIVKVLEPFEEATHTVCQDDTCISSVIPCIQALTG